MGNIIEIGHVYAGFTSVYDAFDKVFDQNIPVDERVWSSSSHKSQELEVQFDGLYEVTRITARQISTDQTTYGFRHTFYPRTESGELEPRSINKILDVNVGRSETDYGYSYDNDPVKYPLLDGWKLERKSVGPMDVTLNQPVTAMGVQLFMKGHGWFRCVDIRFYGKRLRRLTATEMQVQRQRMIQDYPCIRQITELW